VHWHHALLAPLESVRMPNSQTEKYGRLSIQMSAGDDLMHHGLLTVNQQFHPYRTFSA